MKTVFLTLSVLCFMLVDAQLPTVLKMKRQGGVSVVPCKVNGLKLNFIFDTGASDVSISVVEASFMLKNGYLDSTDIIGTSNYLDANGNLNEGIVINLKEVEIAGLKMYNVRASIVKNISAPLLLGQSAISKLGKVQIDLDSNTLTILNVATDSDAIPPSNNDSSEVIRSTLKTKDDIKEIQSKISDDDFEGAISTCNDLLSNEHSRKDEIYFLRGYAKSRMEDYNSAIDDYTTAIKFNPLLDKAFCFRALSKKALKNLDQALIDINKSISIDPKDGYYYYVRAGIKSEKKNFKESILDYNKAIEIDPTSSDYYFDRGYAKEELKDFVGAFTDFNKVIQLEPENHAAYLNRGYAKAGLKNYEGALLDYNRSIELNEENAGTYYLRGDVREKLKDLNGALEDYNKAFELDTTLIQAAIAAAIVKQSLKENDWLYVLSQNDQKWYIRSNYESFDDGIIKIWIKQEIKTKKFQRNGNWVTYNNVKMLLLCEFDCSNRLSKYDSTIFYDSKGNNLQQSDYETDWKPIVPETIQEQLFKTVCEKFNN